MLSLCCDLVMGNYFNIHAESDIVTYRAVSVRDVYNILNDLISYLLILDLRSADEFKKSHIDLAVNTDGLTDMLFRSQESPFTTIIVYEECDCSQHDSTIRHFCARMSKHRHANEGGEPLVVLHLKSFAKFYSMYPFQCTNTPMYEEGRLFPSQITDNIFLSNFGVASSKEVIQTLGITHVLNCTQDCPFVGEAAEIADSSYATKAAINSLLSDESTSKQANRSSGITLAAIQGNNVKRSLHDHGSEPMQLRIPVIDEKDEQIHTYFITAIQFLEGMGVADKAIIHCKHGQSRSAIVSAAYLVHSRGWTAQQAMNHLKACRPKVCPNEGFRGQLQSFAENYALNE